MKIEEWYDYYRCISIYTVIQEGSVTFLILQSRTVNDAWFNLHTLFIVSGYISEYVLLV